MGVQLFPVSHQLSRPPCSVTGAVDWADIHSAGDASGIGMRQQKREIKGDVVRKLFERLCTWQRIEC